MKISKNEIIEKRKDKIFRYPNLNTVLMVEDFLEQNQDSPITPNELFKRLPRQVMRPTLQVILEYLWKSGKIIFGPRGIQWIYVEPKHLNKMMKNSLEL